MVYCVAEGYSYDGGGGTSMGAAYRECDGNCDFVSSSGGPGYPSLPSPVGVRIVASLRAPTVVECQLFDPARPTTLTDGTITGTMVYTPDPYIALRLPASSRIGIVSRGASIDVESIDVQPLAAE